MVSGGGALVSTTTGGSFVEMLRKRMVLMTLGALRLTGLEATLAVPVQTGAATGYWLATEGTSITESQQTFAQMSLTPKTVGAYTEISDKLLKQSSASAEMIVTRDLAAVLAVAADAAGLVGSGASGEPTGIINTSGIGSVTGTSLDYDKALEFQSDVLGQNALISRDACGYITTTAVAKLLANRQRFTGVDSPLWQGNLAEGTVAGFPAYSTEQMPTGDMLFGDFSQLVIAEWGRLSISINPFADFRAGIIGVRGLWTLDLAVRHAKSFSLATSIT